ncbi:MAG: ABC transporter permease [Gammaproteobacteria bacterium]|nr:ABC transporter permease [Gammaproteobacteria bacterium]
MNHLLLSAKLDISEAIRSRWFLVYALVFGAVVVGLFVSGLTESRVMGFTGLSRLLVTYLQITMALLPLFVLLTTVRSMVGDRESGTFEYMLSLPVGLGSWFWGKCVGRFVVVFLPVFAAMALAIAWGALKGLEIPVMPVVYYTGLLLSLALCFLGFGFLISTLTRSTEVATGLALIIWLFMLLFLDLILLGILIKTGLDSESVVAVALLNPLQVFRTASMMLFDPQLVLLGPSAYVILDHFGGNGYIVWALIYPALLGIVTASIGFFAFRKSDLV